MRADAGPELLEPRPDLAASVRWQLPSTGRECEYSEVRIEDR